MPSSNYPMVQGLNRRVSGAGDALSRPRSTLFSERTAGELSARVLFGTYLRLSQGVLSFVAETAHERLAPMLAAVSPIAGIESNVVIGHFRSRDRNWYQAGARKGCMDPSKSVTCPYQADSEVLNRLTGSGSGADENHCPRSRESLWLLAPPSFFPGTDGGCNGIARTSKRRHVVGYRRVY